MEEDDEEFFEDSDDEDELLDEKAVGVEDEPKRKKKASLPSSKLQKKVVSTPRTVSWGDMKKEAKVNSPLDVLSSLSSSVVDQVSDDSDDDDKPLRASQTTPAAVAGKKINVRVDGNGYMIHSEEAADSFVLTDATNQDKTPKKSRSGRTIKAKSLSPMTYTSQESQARRASVRPRAPKVSIDAIGDDDMDEVLEEGIAMEEDEEDEEDDEDDEESEWLDGGDPAIGQRVRRCFGRSWATGTVFAWRDETAKSEPLYRVRYEDEYVEDLSMMELAVARKAQATWEKSGGVDKILAHRKGITEDEYLIKWKGRSYRHTTWERKDVIACDVHGTTRVRKFHEAFGYLGPAEKDRFPLQYLQIDRVLKRASHDEKGYPCEPSVLVKWCSLSYEEATWEPVATLDGDDAVAKYDNVEDRPRRVLCKNSRRGEGFEQYTESRSYAEGRRLRDYQVEGVNWLIHNWHEEQGCILADEMGLGKTAQTIATFRHLREKEGVTGAFLVVAPLSTIQHWAREVEAWAGMHAVVYHGSAKSRELIRENEWELRGKGECASVKFDVLITTYEIANSDVNELSKVHWEYLVVDEAHRLKNKKSLLVHSLRQLKWSQCHLLTGTPIQNNMEELHSMLSFIDVLPPSCKDALAFVLQYEGIKTAEKVKELQGLLHPIMLRRLKEDVETTLAAKEETIIWLDLTPMQRKYYRAVIDRNFSVLNKSGKNGAGTGLRNVSMELRKLCLHPFLIKGAEESECAMLQDPSNQEAVNQLLIESSTKFSLMDKLLAKLKADGHRVLIFSQMTRVLDMIEDCLRYREHKYERIDGNVKGIDRQQAIDRFSDPSSQQFVFLLGTKAGGVGINLTAADTVIIFDSDWNPQNDLQAQARCHRIGQEKAVQVFRLITSNTYEQQMFERSCKKLGLDQALLLGRVEEKEPSKKEMEDMLKFGAYDILKDNGGETTEEQSIEQILEHRAEKVVYENEGGVD